MANVWRQAPSGRIDGQALRVKGSLATLFFEAPMATLTYAYVGVCAGGGHVHFTVQLNAGAPQPFTITTDEFLLPLSALTPAERDIVAQTVLKLRMTGKTRAQMKADLQAGFVVTI